MSYAYVIMTNQPCAWITKQRGMNFSYLGIFNDKYTYIREHEGKFGLFNRDENKISISDSGFSFLNSAATESGIIFIAYLILKNRQSIFDNLSDIQFNNPRKIDKETLIELNKFYLFKK